MLTLGYNMKNIVVLNLLVLVTTILLSVCDAREILYIGVYLFDIVIIVCFCKNNKTTISVVYLKKHKWQFVAILGLLISNILATIFHDAVKWIARPFFWMVSISYVALLFLYAYAFMFGKAKLPECVTMIVPTMTALLISLPIYQYYRLSFSIKYQNNVLVYKHYADALYEETTFYSDDSCCYVKIINKENQITTIYYSNYPSNISHIDTTFVGK